MKRSERWWKNKFTLFLVVVFLMAAGFSVYDHVLKKSDVFAAEAGSRAPDFTLKDLKGIEISLSDLKGKGVILTYWATYCPPCDKEMPFLQNTYLKYQDKGIEVLAVNAGEPTVLVNQYISKKGVNFPILLDRDEIVQQKYQIQNLPVTVFINSEGVIVKTVSGELTEGVLEAGIKDIKR